MQFGQLQIPDFSAGFPSIQGLNLPMQDILLRSSLPSVQERIADRYSDALMSDDVQDFLNKEITNNEEMYQQMGGHIKSPDELEPFFQQAAQETGVDIRVLKAIAKQESDFNPRVRSKAGAMGVMQLMPGTAKEVGVTNPYDPAQNILGGARYFKKMYNMFGGDIDKALAAYNAGPGNVRKYGGIPPFKETQNYVRKIRNGYAINNALRQMQFVR